MLSPHRPSPPPPSRHPCARLAATALLLLALGACRGRQEASGPIPYGGSGTIGDELLPALSAAFEQRGGRPVKNVQNVGSTRGYGLLVDGGVELAGLARSLKSAERADRPYYVVVGYDALAVYVHPSNPVPSLSRAQLKALFTGKVRNWKDVGGPDAPVELVSVDTTVGSGTTDFFREEVLEGARFAPTTVQNFPPDIIKYISGRPHGISFGTLSVEAKGVRFLPVDGVAPTPAQVRSAEYPLSRPLLLVTREVPEGSLQAFLDFAVSPEGQALVEKYFVPVHSR